MDQDIFDPLEVKQCLAKFSFILSFSVDEIYSAFNLPPDEFRAKYGFGKPAKTAALCTHCKMGKRATDARRRQAVPPRIRERRGLQV